jgi:hypothetical protein
LADGLRHNRLFQMERDEQQRPALQ